MRKKANNKHEINDLISERWSPRAFNPHKEIVERDLHSLIEAARWAPSSFNEQPWRFFIGQKNDDAYNSILSTLVEWNQKWVVNVPLLIMNVGKKTFTHNGKQNVTFKYDLGQAVAFMVIEALHRGIVSHQMSGFNAEKAAKLFNIPSDFQVVSVTAFGYFGGLAQLPDDMKKLEFAQRSRKNFNEIVFGKQFGHCFENI